VEIISEALINEEWARKPVWPLTYFCSVLSLPPPSILLAYSRRI
jgi:hypothetical protein